MGEFLVVMATQFSFFESADELEGFRYRPAFIDRSVEDALVARVTELPFREFDFHGF